MSAPTKNANVDKKLWKKQNKHRQMLWKREKINCIDTPSAFIKFWSQRGHTDVDCTDVDCMQCKRIQMETKELCTYVRYCFNTGCCGAFMILCVSNGGLDNGVTYEEILHLFSCYGDRCDVIMFPQKPYSFVCYGSVEAGEAAYTSLNGHTLANTEQRKAQVIIYVSYVSEVPDSVCPSTEHPPGLVLLKDFVTNDYADQIICSINWADTLSSSSAQQKELKHRRVKHYGYEFKYSINNVDPDDPLPDSVPDVYKPLLEKLLDTGHVKYYPDQLTINQYQPGQGIPPHVDTPSAFEDGLVSLSLGSQVLMEFRHPDGRHLSVLLPDRSALIMTGESRYIWSHGITPRKSDIIPIPGGGLTLSQRGIRTSFTFRKITGVRHEEDKSDQPSLPDSDSTAAQLESLHVHQVYEKIADNFSGTRHTPWPHIAEFLQQQPAGSMLADIGCGNGKYFGINKNIYELGSDRSSNLAEICHSRKFQVFVGDMLAIPLRAAMFDVCLCIAVIHHLATHERRVRAVSELLKILRPGGQALIYVWAIEQELNKTKSKYLKHNKHAMEEDGSKSDISNDKPTGTEDNMNIKSTECEVEVDTGIHECDNTKCKFIGKNTGNDKKENGTGNLLETCVKDSSNVNVTEKRDNSTVDEKQTSSNSDLTETAVNKHDKIESFTKDKGDMNETGARSKTKPPKLEVHVNRTMFKQQDVLVPWQLKNKENKTADVNTFHRFYHVFEKGEMEKLCESIDCCRIVKSYYDQGNWAVVLEKI